MNMNEMTSPSCPSASENIPLNSTPGFQSTPTCHKFNQASLLHFRNNFYEVVEELKLRRDQDVENEGKIQKLLHEQDVLHQKWMDECNSTRYLKEEQRHLVEKTKKHYDDQIRQVLDEQGKKSVGIEIKDKEIQLLKNEVRSLQLTKYNLEKNVTDLERRVNFQSTMKDATYQQLSKFETSLASTKLKFVSVCDVQGKLERNVEEAVKLMKKLSYINEHQKCTATALRSEVAYLKQQITGLKVKLEIAPTDVVIAMADKDTKIRSLENRVKTLEERKASLEERVQQMNLQKKDLLNSLDGSHRVIADHVSCNEKQRNEIDKLSIESAGFKTHIDELSRGLDTKTKQLQEQEDLHEEALINWNQKEKDAQVKFDEFNVELDDLRKEFSNLEQVRFKLTENNSQLQLNLQKYKDLLNCEKRENQVQTDYVTVVAIEVQTDSDWLESVCRMTRELEESQNKVKALLNKVENYEDLVADSEKLTKQLQDLNKSCEPPPEPVHTTTNSTQTESNSEKILPQIYENTLKALKNPSANSSLVRSENDRSLPEKICSSSSIDVQLSDLASIPSIKSGTDSNFPDFNMDVQPSAVTSASLNNSRIGSNASDFPNSISSSSDVGQPSHLGCTLLSKSEIPSEQLPGQISNPSLMETGQTSDEDCSATKSNTGSNQLPDQVSNLSLMEGQQSPDLFTTNSHLAVKVHINESDDKSAEPLNESHHNSFNGLSSGQTEVTETFDIPETPPEVTKTVVHSDNAILSDVEIAKVSLLSPTKDVASSNNIVEEVSIKEKLNVNNIQVKNPRIVADSDSKSDKESCTRDCLSFSPQNRNESSVNSFDCGSNFSGISTTWKGPNECFTKTPVQNDPSITTTLIGPGVSSVTNDCTISTPQNVLHNFPISSLVPDKLYHFASISSNECSISSEIPTTSLDMLPNISEEYKAKSNLNFDLTDSKIVENTVASTEVLEEGPVCPKSRSSSSSKYPSRSEFDTANCEKGCNSNVENQSAPNLKLDMRKIGNSSEIPTCSKGLESQISGKPDSKPSCVEKIFVREQPILLSNLTTGIGAKPSALGTAAPSMAKIQRDVIASFLNKIAPSYDGRGDEPARLNTTGAGKVKQDRPRLTSDVMFFKNENLNIVSANDAVGRNSNRKRQFVPPTGNNPGILNDDAISKTRVNSEKKVRFSPCNDTQSKAQRKQFTGDDSLFSDDDFNNN